MNDMELGIQVSWNETALQAAVDAARDEAMYESEYDYGYGGESYEYQRVANWNDVVQAALDAFTEQMYLLQRDGLL